MKRRIRRGLQQILQRTGYQLNRSGTAPNDAFALQRELIKVREPIVFDVGAHVGRVAKIYRDWFPLASIYCFEPFPQSYQQLADRVENDPRIFCYETAVSEVKGTAVFNANRSPATNSLLMTDERGAAFWGEGLLDTTSQVEVNTTAIDTFCTETGITHIDILKMDVQGAEYSVLEGARDLLANQGISLIYMELMLCPTYQGQRKFHEYLSFLDSFGYDLLDLVNQSRRHNQLIVADAVFLSSSFKEQIKKAFERGGVAVSQ